MTKSLFFLEAGYNFEPSEIGFHLFRATKKI